MEPPVVINHRAESSDPDQNGEIPQSVVEHAGCSAEENEAACHPVGDCFFGQLHGGKSNEADSCSVEARKEGVGGQRQFVTNAGDADGEGKHAEGTRQTWVTAFVSPSSFAVYSAPKSTNSLPPQKEAKDGGQGALAVEVDAVEQFRAGRTAEGLRQAE